MLDDERVFNVIMEISGVFRTQSTIYDEFFLQK